LPAYAEGARAGMQLLARGLLGEDPCQIGKINARMDELLKGHAYAKSALDMACWDILGKFANQPLCHLLGGRLTEKVKLFKVVSRQEPDAMVARIRQYQKEGFKQFQMKVGAVADVDIERIHKVSAELRAGDVLAADANTGWRQHEAIRVVKAIRDVDIYIEQPCLTYEECLAVRQHTDHPIILDECMEDLRALMRGCQDRAMDVVNLKINRVGGLTKARLFRDLAVNLGITMTMEDSWGSEIATAVFTHLAHSTPKGFHFQSSAFHEYHSINVASGAPEIEDGFMTASDLPGLGVSLNRDVLGLPISVIA
jgi:L-alanine-DL-glutamate epimerase-like enolase superfamily enzyme